MRLLINAFESSLSKDQRNLVKSKTAAIEELNLNFGPEKNNFLLDSDNIQGWYDLLNNLWTTWERMVAIYLSSGCLTLNFVSATEFGFFYKIK